MEDSGLLINYLRKIFCGGYVLIAVYLLDAEMKFRHLSCWVPLRVFLFVCLSVCLFVCLWYDFLQGPLTDLSEISGHDRGP